MPASHPPIIAHPAKPFRTLADAARDNELIMLRCNLCKRGMTFLATDLVQVLNPKHPVHITPLTCSVCGKSDHIDIRCRSIGYNDLGRLEVRRLVGSKQVWLWANKLLGQ